MSFCEHLILFNIPTYKSCGENMAKENVASEQLFLHNKNKSNFWDTKQ